ncbi:hypothetical protein KIN20_009694 [Parelaphostrongylus tenuis]|uniref:Uncharacterized protein n=1 Tax=Parelaphostrongylus tenuis TaxID=148309 RepID=A0AAD5MS63_PARTN|nr:hypothetical protein KIN20_009694 [Parelaphostrongylus tenuis]
MDWGEDFRVLRQSSGFEKSHFYRNRLEFDWGTTVGQPTARHPPPITKMKRREEKSETTRKHRINLSRDDTSMTELCGATIRTAS